MILVKVEDSTYVRDTKSRALINTDNAAREEYYSKVQMLKANKSEINKLNNDVTELKSELSEIKNLLNQLLLK
jgi:BMFP domain-containing protein YqiC